MANAEFDSQSTSDAVPTLDDAIEQCIRDLENGQLDIPRLTSQYSEFEKEIVEFLENWGEMESVAGELADNRAFDGSLETPEFEPGIFGDFELLSIIGGGGMGTIYKARQISLDRIVALKMIRGGSRDDGRFQTEAEAAASLTHPGIVAIHGVGVQQGQQFINMQFIEGCNLQQYVNRSVIAPADAARITEKIARAVHYAHQHGILHRDLKPANVLIDRERNPYVTDFGLAKQIEQDTELTQSGTILGTPGYMAPEQATGSNKNLTTATDVYGLGALLYALLTGRAPFSGDSSLQILRQVVEEPVASPRQRNPAVDRDLETICLKCLEKSPELRYSSAEELADDLNRFLNNTPVTARPVSQMEKCWRWCQRNRSVAMLSIAVIALLIAASIIASFLAWSEHKARLLSDEKNILESSLNSDLSRALHRAKRDRSNLLMNNGLAQAANRNFGEALLWFSEAAELADDSRKVRSNLILCQSWLREHPMPIDAILLGQEYCDEEYDDELEFQPNGSAILYRSNRQAVVWDHQFGKQLHLTMAHPQLTCARWSPDGSSIIIGQSNGRVIKCDIKTGRDQLIWEFNESITDIEFIHGGRWVAIAAGKQVRFANLIDGQLFDWTIQRKEEVRKLVADSTGTRLAVIDLNKNSALYTVEFGKFEERFSFNCHYRSMQDKRRAFWPRFIRDGRALLIRIGEAHTGIFESDSGKKLCDVPLANPAYCVDVAPDESGFITGSFNYAQHYRLSGLLREPARGLNSDDVPAEQQLNCVPGVRFPHDNVVVGASVGRNGIMATGGWNNDVRLWKTQALSIMSRTFDVPEKAVPISVLPHQTPIRRIAFSPDGRQLVTIQVDGLVRLWNIPNLDTRSYDVPVEPGGSLVKLVDEERWLICGKSQWTGHITNATTRQFHDGAFTGGNKGLSLQVHGHLLDAAISPDRQRLATVHAGQRRSGNTYRKGGGEGGWLRIWNVNDNRPLHDPIPMPSEPRWVTWQPNQNRLAVCTCLMEIIIVDATTYEILDVWETWPNARQTMGNNYLFPQNPINEKIDFSPDGKSLVVWSSRKPGFGVWDGRTGKPRLPWLTNDSWPLADIVISPNGQQIAIAGGRNPVAQVFDLQSLQFIGVPLQHASAVHSVCFSPDGQRLITGCRDGHARVFDWKTGRLLLKDLTHDGDVRDALFTPNSEFIITVGDDNQLRVWNANDGSLALRPFQVPGGSTQLLISPDSRFVIACGGQIRGIDLSELQEEPNFDFTRVRKISELLANKTFVDGTLVTISATEWLKLWNDLFGSPNGQNKGIVEVD